jgi:hypothetical protein
MLRQELSLVMEALAISLGKAEARASTLYSQGQLTNELSAPAIRPKHLMQRTSVVH